MTSRSSFKTVVLPAAIIVVGFIMLFVLDGRINACRPQLPEDYADRDLSFNGASVRGFALGTEGLMADWYFMRGLQYIGDKLLKHADEDIDLNDLRPLNPRLLYPYLQNATDLDPHFIAAYSYGAVVMPAIDPNKAIDLARKGIANNPDSWRLYQHLGYIYWKLGRYEDAAATYAKGAEIPGAAPFMHLMAAAMKTEGGSRETARTIYREMLAGSDEEQVRLTAQRRLMQLDSLDERDAIDAALHSFQQTNGRCPATFAEIVPRLAESKVAKERGFHVDAARNLIDPSGAPYLLDPEKCRAVLDPGKTGIAVD